MILLISLLFLRLVSPVAAAIPCGGDEREASPEFYRAVALYNEGWGGSDEALLKAMEQLEGMLRRHGQESALMKAYYGSACVARARMAPDRKKTRWLRRGAAELEVAVKAAPEDVQVRLLRAVTFAVLPRMAGKAATAREDFRWLVTQAEDVRPKNERQKKAAGSERPAGVGSDLSPECRQAIFYHAGAFALRNREPQAVEWLERAVEIEAKGGIEKGRVSRMLQLARRQLPRESQVPPEKE